MRIFPSPDLVSTYRFMWVEFSVIPNSWDNPPDYDAGVNGINNLNTLPFDNIPYESINAIGKQWIRRFSLALSKETLGQIRGKFQTIPIPGESVNLNADALQVTYSEMAKIDAEKSENVLTIQKRIPNLIFQG